MKKLTGFILTLLVVLVLCSSISAYIGSYPETFQPTIYPWVFYVPENVTPTLKYVMWGYYGSPASQGAARSTAQHKFEYPAKDAQTPEGMKVYMVRLTGDITLQNFKIKWNNKKGALLKVLKSGDSPAKEMAPDVKVGVTLVYSFTRGNDIYSTEIVVPNTCIDHVSPFMGEKGELRSTINGLVFSLTDKEIRTRKVFNALTNSWVLTTEWKKNGKPIE